jgi:hypothetical protein
MFLCWSEKRLNGRTATARQKNRGNKLSSVFSNVYHPKHFQLFTADSKFVLQQHTLHAQPQM